MHADPKDKANILNKQYESSFSREDVFPITILLCFPIFSLFSYLSRRSNVMVKFVTEVTQQLNVDVDNGLIMIGNQVQYGIII